MQFPTGCEFLGSLGAIPRMVEAALPLVGIVETPGSGNSSIIMGWAAELGLRRFYSADSVPWCGLFVAIVAQRAGKVPPSNPLWALNWSAVGEPAGQPCLGDVCVFVRPGGGHVALYLSEDSQAYHVLGGNQADRVCITRIEKHRLHAARKPEMSAPPASRRPYIVGADGRISHNEE